MAASGSTRFRSLQEAVSFLADRGQVRFIREEVDPDLVMAAVQRRVHAAGGPALFFARVKGSPFPAVSNLYGTSERVRLLFRDTLKAAKTAIALRADPQGFLSPEALLRGKSPLLRDPLTLASLPLAGLRALPRRVSDAPILRHRTRLSLLPQIKSWPKDGGAYILLPQVYTEHPDAPGVLRSNLGMYRVQISGNRYERDIEAGLHYQIHRGIGVHHHAALRRGEPLKVSIFVGGPPAHALAAVMPLPEGMSELLFAGLIGGRSFRHLRRGGHLISADADFCLTGTLDPGRTLPEGPFGDHLGYYSLAHDFPVLKVEAVYHRPGALWHFTAVGRPPQEDAGLAELIHELSAPAIPREIPGLHAVHAVEASGVHPLLLALGSERYVPYGPRRPLELHTLAHAVLGFGQLSLAKYLVLAAREDDPSLQVRDIPRFFRHVLERLDPASDLHFITRTTMDTLDYSGGSLNQGSKLVLTVAGARRRELGPSFGSASGSAPLGPDPEGRARKVREAVTPLLPPGFSGLRSPLPGILVVEGPPWDRSARAPAPLPLRTLGALIAALETLGPPRDSAHPLYGYPLLVVVDDSAFASANLDNFLWVAFTRSDPAPDLDGLFAFTENKHWGCRGTMVLDARIKPHHAPPLEEDPEVLKQVEALAAPGKSLHGIY